MTRGPGVEVPSKPASPITTKASIAPPSTTQGRGGIASLSPTKARRRLAEFARRATQTLSGAIASVENRIRAGRSRNTQEPRIAGGVPAAPPVSTAWRERLEAFRNNAATLGYAKPGSESFKTAASPAVARDSAPPSVRALPQAQASPHGNAFPRLHPLPSITRSAAAAGSLARQLPDSARRGLASLLAGFRRGLTPYARQIKDEIASLRREWRTPGPNAPGTATATIPAAHVPAARSKTDKPRTTPRLKLPSFALPRIRLPIRMPGTRSTAQSPSGRGGRLLPLGLDIGTTAIKWAQVSKEGASPRVIRMGLEPIGVGPAAPAELRQPAVREQLKQLAATHKLSGPVALSIPVDDVRFRLVKMPVLPADEMQQALRWQVEQNLPPDTQYQDLVVDYTALAAMPGLPESRILLVTVPKKRIAALLEGVHSAGLLPVAVEVDPSAVQACLAWQQRLAANETALLLHLGSSSASFSILVGGHLVFSRPILTTGNSLTLALSEQLRVSFSEAEQLKCAHGLLRAPGLQQAQNAPDPSGKMAAVSQTLSSPMENLMVDLLHAFKGFSHQMTQSQIQRFDRVYLDGGGARLPGLISWLQLRMGAPVEILNPVAGIALDSAIATSRDWQPLAPQLSVAIGLAARDLVGSGP